MPVDPRNLAMAQMLANRAPGASANPGRPAAPPQNFGVVPPTGGVLGGVRPPPGMPPQPHGGPVPITGGIAGGVHLPQPTMQPAVMPPATGGPLPPQPLPQTGGPTPPQVMPRTGGPLPPQPPKPPMTGGPLPPQSALPPSLQAAFPDSALPASAFLKK